MKVLITGATGFVGRAFVEEALSRGYAVRVALRAPAKMPAACEAVFVSDMDGSTDWSEALQGCEAVVHLAARVHVMKERLSDPLAEFLRVNTEGTLHLARQAVKAGVSRFLFMSTVKVNGEGKEMPYTEADKPAPEDPYAISKYEAEKGLMEICEGTGMTYTVLRPPLVYGPEVRANFLKLLEGVNKGFPFPLARIQNRRSLIYVANLTSAMAFCLESEGAKNKVFLVSDGDDVATPELVRRLAKALGTKGLMLPVPLCLLNAAGKILGRTKQIERLLGSLSVDPSALNREIGWIPPHTMEAGLSQTAMWYKKRTSRL